MMEIVLQVLAFVGGLFIFTALCCFIVHLWNLFERVESLEVKDDVRRDDIIDLQSQIMHIKMKKINRGDADD